MKSMNSKLVPSSKHGYSKVRDIDISWSNIEVSLRNVMLDNSPILFANGYTPLHLACVEGDKLLLSQLIHEERMDINAIAADTMQPIHVACLSRNTEIVTYLLTEGANIEAEITEEMYRRYKKINHLNFKFLQDTKWCDDFSDKLTLLTFAIRVTYLHPKLASTLIECGANFKIRCPRNKTLLMYAFEKNIYIGNLILGCNIKDEKFINARDSDGFSAIHYLLHPQKCGNFSFNGQKAERIIDFSLNCTILKILTKLVNSGADIYATVNEDSSTFPLNIAGYKRFHGVLEYLLPQYNSLSESNVLHYVMLFPEDRERYVSDLNWERLLYNHKQDIFKIVKDFIFRLTFRLQVNDDEKMLMDYFIETRLKFKKMVDTCKKDAIPVQLKNEFIHYGSESISRYDLMLLSAGNSEKFRSLVKNNTFMNAYESFEKSGDTLYFDRWFYARRKDVYRKIELLKELRKVEHLRKAIPLPYELVLEIVEYLLTEELKKFIDAFYIY